MRQKASVEVAPAQLDSMKVCKPCHARKVRLPPRRQPSQATRAESPTCRCFATSLVPSARLVSATAKNDRVTAASTVRMLLCQARPSLFDPTAASTSTRPSSRCRVRGALRGHYSAPLRADLLRFRRGGRRRRTGQDRAKVRPDCSSLEDEPVTAVPAGPANDAVPTPETSRALLNDVLLSPSHSVPASLVYASGTVSSNQSGGAVSAGQTGEAPPGKSPSLPHCTARNRSSPSRAEPAALSGTPPATAPSSRFLGSNSQQPTVPTYLPLALLTPNQQLLPPTAPPVPFISIFQPEAPESVDTSTPPSRRISIVGGQSAADTRLPFAPPLPPRSTSALGAQLPALPPLPAVHAHAANGPASFAPPLCPKFPSIPDARSRQSTSPHRDFARRARAEPPAATQPHPHDSTTFANVDFSSDYSSRRPTEQPQHTFLPLVPPRPASGGLNAVLATGTSSSFDTLYAYN